MLGARAGVSKRPVAPVLLHFARLDPTHSARPRARARLATMALPLKRIIATPLRRTRPPGRARAARRRAACRCRPTPEVDIIARTLARPQGAGRAGAGHARPRVRPQRRRLHRQRAARARDRRVDGRRRRARRRIGARAQLLAVAAPAARQPVEHRAPLRRLERVLPDVARRADGVFVRLFPHATTTRSTTRRRRSSTTSAASCASRPGERFLDIGCGWGALIFWAAENYGVARDRHHAVAEPVRPRHARRSPRAASPAACGSSCATTSTCPTTRRTTRSRASACSSTSARATTTATSARSSAC